MACDDVYVLLANGYHWTSTTSPALLGEIVYEMDRLGVAQCVNCAYLLTGARRTPHPSALPLCPNCGRQMHPVAPAALMPVRLLLHWPLITTALSEEETALFLAGYGRAAGRA